MGADLAAEWGVAAELRNAGIGGELAAATVERLIALVKTEWPQLVVWQAGANDATTGVDPEAFRATLARSLAAARAARTPIVFIDQQFYPVIEDRAGHERYVGVIAEVGARDHAALFSRYALMRQWDAASPGALAAMLSADRFHMGDRGYACLAQPLAAEFARYLEGASIPVGRLAPKPAADKSR